MRTKDEAIDMALDFAHWARWSHINRLLIIEKVYGFKPSYVISHPDPDAFIDGLMQRMHL